MTSRTAWAGTLHAHARTPSRQPEIATVGPFGASRTVFAASSGTGKFWDLAWGISGKEAIWDSVVGCIFSMWESGSMGIISQSQRFKCAHTKMDHCVTTVSTEECLAIDVQIALHA